MKLGSLSLELSFQIAILTLNINKVLKLFFILIGFFFVQPVLGLNNKIVSGANLRTKSSVWFGEPSLNRKFYETTTHHTYIPKSIPYTYKRQNFLKKSSIPLDHFS